MMPPMETQRSREGWEAILLDARLIALKAIAGYCTTCGIERANELISPVCDGCRDAPLNFSVSMLEWRNLLQVCRLPYTIRNLGPL